MASSIKIKRSETSGNPSALGAGELAYSALTENINTPNGGDRLYIGTGTETAGNAVNHVVIGGKYFTDMLDHAPGTLTASSAIVVDATSKIDVIKTTNLQLGGSGVTNVIASTNTNGNIELIPNGTGLVRIANAFTLPNTAGTGNYVLTSNGAGGSSWQITNITGLAAFTSAQLATALTDETGTGLAVFSTSPTLVTPALGTPSALVGTNITGTAASLTAGTVTTNANLTGHITSVGNAAVLGSFTSAELAAAVTNETGTGKLAFATTPTFTTSVITDSASFSAFNTIATTLNIGGAATTLSLGAATGTTTINNDLSVKAVTVTGNILPATTLLYSLGSPTYRFKDIFLSGNTIDLGGAVITGSAGGISVISLNSTPIGNTDPSTGVFTTLSSTGNVTVGGNLVVNGTTTTVNSTTITVDDKNLELGSITSPTDAGADGGGITLKGTTDKTLNWVLANTAWTSSENFDIAIAKTYKINAINVLSANTLGSGVTASSLTSVGTIATGVWNGTVITPVYGGTGLATATSRGILFGNGTSNMGVTAASAIDGSFLRSDSTGNPYWNNVIDGGTY